MGGAMPAFQDIFSLVGAPSVVAASTFGIFEFFDRVASEQAKRALSEHLKAFDVRSSTILPTGTYRTFQRLFGTRQFSISCFVRSAGFSIAAITILFFTAFLLHYDDFSSETDENDAPLKGLAAIWVMFGSTRFDRSLLLVFVLWVGFSLIPDFINLHKTRLILLLLKKRSYRTLMLLGILTLDVLITFIVFYVLFITFTHTFSSIDIGVFDTITENLSDLWNVLTLLPMGGIREVVSFYLSFNSVDSVLFYAGLVPSAWLWLYVASIFIMRVLLRNEGTVGRLKWALDIDRAPFRSIGVIAGAFVAIASVCAHLASVAIRSLVAI
jgi:hypothetical protein